MELVVWTRGAPRHPELGDGCLGTAERGRWRLRRVGGLVLCSHCAGRAVLCVPPGPRTASTPPQAKNPNRAAVISTKMVQCLP